MPAEQGIRDSQLGFDIYSITPRLSDMDNIKIYKSTIAPIRQGNYSQLGGGEQILVPNRAYWNSPEKIGEVVGERFK